MSAEEIPQNFWEYVHELAERVAATAPEGHTARVEIETVDGRTFVPGVVQRFPPFLICEVPAIDDPTEVLIVRENLIAHVRIKVVRKDKETYPVGFSVGEVKPT